MRETSALPAVKNSLGALVKNADEKRRGNCGQTPPASAQFPAALAPDAKGEDDAGRRDEHADRAQWIGGPATPEQGELALDAEASCRGKKADGAPKRDRWRSGPGGNLIRLERGPFERDLIRLRCCECHLFADHPSWDIIASRCTRVYAHTFYGVCGGPASGDFTGVAMPMNSVSVFLPEFDTQIFPLASMASP